MPIGCVLWIILIVVFSISMYGWGEVIIILVGIIINTFLICHHRNKIRKKRRNNMNKK